ncbi:FkbM family methyltransferase [Patulibacter sp. SYSU D01012]|uniref:FkbM family methyltransferase n=1 Tax=Patulibacter sp. SYSU D01012 TaxID=2817381 RepID=UPI001B30A577|nr:FkbM family methyltransferase [Patulibacter sp. SYSU D01012]
MAFSGTVQSRVATVADRFGATPALRAAYRRVSPLARRNARDDAHLRLLLAHGLAHDANAVDVGAHGGDVLADLVRLAPAGHHVAFEPLPDQAAALRERFPGVDVHQAAVGAQAGAATFTRVVSNPQLSGLRDRGFAGEETEQLEVPVLRLDDVCDPDRPVSLLKIDVEGAELGVLEGGLELLHRDRPTVVFEHGVGGADHFGVTSEQVHDLLVGEVGLRIFDIDGEGPLSRQAFAARFRAPIWFFVAHR